jgi:predicted metal-dependent HD superfamily phosphohydrolase
MTGKIIHLLWTPLPGNELQSSIQAVRLIEKYSKNIVFIHNLSHLYAMLKAAEKFKDKLADYDSVQLAVWFHDAVYEPRSRTNEIESARLAVVILAELKFSARADRKGRKNDPRN